MYTRLLIPLDGSNVSEQVLPYARFLAGALKLPLELLGVVDVVTIARSSDIGYFSRLVEDGRRASTGYLERVTQTLPGLSVNCSVETGKPEEVIIEKAAGDKGTLIVMGTHGRSGVRRWFLGSTAEKVLRGARNTLLLVRAGKEGKTQGEAAIKSIVVPLDGSTLAETVLPEVVDLAKKTNLEVILTRVYELPISAYYGAEDAYIPNYEPLQRQVREEASSYLVSKVDELRADGLERVSSALLEGSGAEEIITLARTRPDNLVAMCTHGRSGVQRWVLGSVTEKVVRHSGDPVLVIRAA